MKRSFVPRSLAVHDGIFHADEVTAAALLLLCDLIDRDKIVRTRDSAKLMNCEYVCDVGGVYDPSEKLFDHHQLEYSGPLSSAGMILQYLHDEGYFSSDEYLHFRDSLVLGIDAEDNGKDFSVEGLCSFSDVIANFVPIEREVSADEENVAFFESVSFTVGHLRRMRERYLYIKSCKAIVAERMKEGNECLIFDEHIPWQESFFELGGENHPALFVIMPMGEHWKLRGVPPSLEEKMRVRVPLPKEWAGLLEEDFKRVTGIPGAIFCHKGRFISIWETKEEALKALTIVLEKMRSCYGDDI